MGWVLIITWVAHACAGCSSSTSVAMQEFKDISACQFASVEAQKIGMRLKTVCVPVGSGPRTLGAREGAAR